MKENSILKKSLLSFILIITGYISGVYSFSQQVWPINIITANRNAAIAESLSVNFDKYGAYSNLDGKREVPCPAQDSSTAVILVLGQSNSANHAEKKFDTQFPENVLNYYRGKCYSAKSPLLGSSGLEGEYLTLMGDALIKKGQMSNVILIAKSIGGSTVSDWANQGRLTPGLVSTLSMIKSNYRITNVIWHQGESDFTNNTSQGEYRKSFQELKSILTQGNVTAPISMFISTICGYNSAWTAQNPVTSAQKSLVNNRDVFLGVDTDATLVTNDRRPQSPSQEPNCHLSNQGQLKVAELMSNRIIDLLNFEKIK